MQVIPIKTHKITSKDTDILKILDMYLFNNQHPMIKNKSVVAISSKIVSICEGRIVPANKATKDELAVAEADMYLSRNSNKYGVLVSIKNGMFIASSGIDESNGNGNFVLWPKDPQVSANSIREHLVSRSGFNNIAVIITDSRNSPLRWGVTGVAIAHSGFEYLNSYIGKPDIFGRLMRVEKVNVADTLAACSVGVMGEGEEQTPIALIADAPFVHFQDRNPTQEELDALKTDMTDDIYSGMLTAAKWQKIRK